MSTKQISLSRTVRISPIGVRSVVGATLLTGIFLAGCDTKQTELNMPPAEQNAMIVPPGFPTPTIPATNPFTSNKVELGRRLFYEVKMSRDNAHSCGSCHQASNGFSDAGKPVSAGSFGQLGNRNAPGLANVAYNTAFFWDGRTRTIEEQAVQPILNPIELASDSATVVSNLKADPVYQVMFKNAFGDGQITFKRVGEAIATFERTMLSGSSPYDRFKAGDKAAMSDAAQRGMKLFESKEVNCAACHKDFNFTDDEYHSTGVETFYDDEGRQLVTGDRRDNGKFRTPSLRNVALTGPYMHNGKFRTLRDVMLHYNEGGKHNETQDTLIHELHLSDAQISDVITFLQSLTDKDFTSRPQFRNPFGQ